MRDLLTVIQFTMKDMVKRKSFIISSIIIIVMIVIGFNIPNIIKAFKGEDAIFGDTRLLIIDKDNIFENSLDSINDMKIGYVVQIVNEDISFDKIKEKIDADEIDRALIINKDGENIKLEYIVDNLVNIDTPEPLINAVTTIYSNLQISKLNVSEEQLKSINPIIDFQMKQTEEEEVQGNVFVMMIISMVLFYAIFFCASQVSSSITTEKTSKIMETLVTSTSPKTIILGKTIGIALVGLFQILLIVATGIISAKVLKMWYK